MKSFQEALEESTCHKRAIICEIFDINGKLLSRESNRCNPEGGKCHRLGISQNKDNYDTTSHCNWTHAEIMAIMNLPSDSVPYKAVIHGHDFACEKCEIELKKAGVGVIQIFKPEDYKTKYEKVIKERDEFVIKFQEFLRKREYFVTDDGVCRTFRDLLDMYKNTL